MCRSVPQIPVRWTRMSTSLIPGLGSGTSVSHSPRSARLLTSAFMGLAPIVLHVGAGVAHGAGDLVERHELLAAALQGHACGVDGFDGGHRVAPDAGDPSR